jgi:hypothetical protein
MPPSPSPCGYDLFRRLGGWVRPAQCPGGRYGASGIGCFFDDPIHSLIGLQDRRLQAVYMFTVGPALAELGLTDEPAYPRGRV